MYKVTIQLVVAGIMLASCGVVNNGSNSSAVASDRQKVGSTSATPSTARLKKVEVMDPFFGQPAYSMMIPADWAFEGTVLRGPNGSEPPQLVFRASSADGLTGAQQLPRYDWYWSNNAGLIKSWQAKKVTVMEPLPAGEFAKKVVIPEARPGAQVGATEPLPEWSDKVAEQDRTTNARLAAQAAQYHMTPNHVTTDAARIRIQYDLQGRPVEEWIGVLTSSTESQTPMLRSAPMHSYESRGWITGARAPKGQLDASQKLLIAIFKSATADPSWTQKQNAFALQQAQAQQAQTMRESAAALERNRRIFEGSMARTRNMENARHQGAMDTIDHIRDEQTMSNPATGQTGKVSNQYNYSYADEQGRVVQSNSPTFNPSAQFRGNWTQLQPIKH